MIVTCTGCGKRYTFDAANLRGRPSATVRCKSCKTTIVVTAPVPGDETTRLEADANLIPSRERVPEGQLYMPPGRRISLAVLEGNDSGRIFNIDRPKMTLGRGGSDIVLDDAEISREHACLEIRGPRVVVKDLGSTNGTFVKDLKVAQAELDDRDEFRIGATRLMLIVTESGADLGTGP